MSLPPSRKTSSMRKRRREATPPVERQLRRRKSSDSISEDDSEIMDDSAESEYQDEEGDAILQANACVDIGAIEAKGEPVALEMDFSNNNQLGPFPLPLSEIETADLIARIGDSIHSSHLPLKCCCVCDERVVKTTVYGILRANLETGVPIIPESLLASMKRVLGFPTVQALNKYQTAHYTIPNTNGKLDGVMLGSRGVSSGEWLHICESCLKDLKKVHVDSDLPSREKCLKAQLPMVIIMASCPLA